MKSLYVAVTLILISALPAYAGKWSTGTTAPATCAVGDSWTDTNGTTDNRFYTCTATNTWTLNSNQTAIDTKANKAGTVMQWSEWSDGASFTTSSPPVAYNGSLYKCLAPYTKVAGETPDTQTEYFAEVTGVGGGIAHATSDGAYYASRNGAWANLSGVFAPPLGTDDNYVTDAEKTKLTGIAEGAEVNVNADWNASSGDAQILNKPTIPTVSDTAYGVGWNGDTGAASKNAIYDKIETIAGGSMTYPGAGVPVSTGTAWGTSITPGAGVSAALGYAPNTAGGFLLYSTYAADPLINWDATTITETENSPTPGTNTIGVKSGVFQSYDVQLDTWAGVTPGTGVATFLATPSGANLATALTTALPTSKGGTGLTALGSGVSTALGNNTGAVGGLPVIVASGAYTIDTASISANTCASAVAVTASGVVTTDKIIATPSTILSSIAGFGVTTAGAVRVDVYPTSDNVNFQFCNPTGASIDPGSVTFNWMVLR